MDGGRRRIGSQGISRRRFLALSTVGAAGLLATGGYPSLALAQPARRELRHRGEKIVVERLRGRPRVYINREPVRVIDTNGAYRTPNLMFAPETTPEALAKNVVDLEAGLPVEG